MKAIFSVPATGGTPSLRYMGAPLVNPVGISTSSDGNTLYIADLGAGTNGGGAIFSMPSAGNTPTVVAGSDGLHPAALDVAEVGTSDDLYITGTDTSGSPAVYKLAAEGGTAEVVIMGAPLVKPNGISVTTDGTIYVADKAAGKSLPGQVFEVSNGHATAFGPEIEPGNPTGIASSVDGFIVLTSALDPKAGTSQVEIVTAKTGNGSTFNDVIKTNTVSGGLHRARFKDIYAWAGKTQVYAIKITRILADSSTPGGVGLN
jgi:sugar lactone lactonase YvrE